jgi:long-chain acyl-CoA synthetase
MKNKLIHHFLESSAQRFPDKVAVIHEKTRATYRQVNADADQLAAFLVGRDVQKGDRVVILMENSVEYIVAYYGILKAGAVAVPLSTDLKPDGFNPLLAELEPAAIISSARFERLLQASNLDVPNLNTLIVHNPKLDWDVDGKEVVSFEAAKKTDNICKIRIENSNLANIIYTSGSTGRAKGVMLTHGNIVANADSICQYLQLTDSDIQMVVLPFFYVMGKSLLNTIFAVGGTLVLNNKFAFPATVINQMIEEKVTLFSGVPSTYAYLLHRSPLKKSREQLTDLRMVTQAGGHMARSIKTALRETLPAHTHICIMYGATEASARLAWLEPEWFKQKIDSIGRAIPGVTLKILEANGAEVPQGERGEVVAGGPNITRGYWKDPQATGKVLDDHGYHTGDIGWQDEEGFIFLEGRKDNLLKVGGHRINPQEVEDALLATELAVEAAVMGVADELLGKRLVALVVPLNGDAVPEVILEKCAGRLPKYKMPSELRFVRTLPKNANGKVDRERCLNVFTAEPQIPQR